MNLPKNVKQDPNTGLYIITNSAGQKFRVNADTQSQLNQYVNSVNSGIPTTVTVTDPNTGNQKTSTFNPTQISSIQTAQANQVQLLTAGKRQAGVIGNADGTYSDLKTGQTITQQQAAEKITAAGLPPETLAAITPKSSPAYQAAQQNINTVINTPSNLTASESQTPNPAIAADNAVVTLETDPVIASETSVAETPIIENATPAFDTGQNAAADAAFLEANASEQQVIDPNSDPNTNIGNDPQEPIPQPQQTISLASDPNTNIGAEGQDAGPPIAQQTISAASDPNTNIGAEGQTVTSPSSVTENVFDPRQEVTENVFDPRQEVTESVFDPSAGGSGQGISTALNNTRSTATRQDTANFQQKPDWRARLSLAPNANYLYKVAKGQAGILAPLQSTDGVIFPYTPGISVTYSAGYEPSDIVHSNYKVYQYKGSSVDTVSITADFTAQDTNEANYLLAVIHFFRSVTKMFYGQDQNPNNGVPPPLCYLSGFGAYTFDAHPLVITNFTYATPTEVDYIRAGSQTNQPGVNVAQQNNIVNSFVPSVSRRANNGLNARPPNFSTQNSLINSEATYVPTKLQLQITCIPIVTRNDISNKFSLKEYATGALLRGSKRSGGGIW